MLFPSSCTITFHHVCTAHILCLLLHIYSFTALLCNIHKWQYFCLAEQMPRVSLCWSSQLTQSWIPVCQLWVLLHLVQPLGIWLGLPLWFLKRSDHLMACLSKYDAIPRHIFFISSALFRKSCDLSLKMISKATTSDLCKTQKLYTPDSCILLSSFISFCPVILQTQYSYHPSLSCFTR